MMPMSMKRASTWVKVACTRFTCFTSPNPAFLRNVLLNLSWAQSLGTAGKKPRLVIASHKYLDEHRLRAMKIEYCQLPFAIYRFQK